MESQNNKPHMRGTYVIVIGCLLLVAGFFLNVGLFYSNSASFNYVMYGLTSIGIILIVIGLAMMFGDL